MTVPSVVLDLVEQFDRNLDDYRSGKYKEAQVRSEFINPFFIALGWDVYNEKHYAEAYKDVVHEDTIRSGGGAELPDYCFRIGGTRKFFVEAKKPSVSIKGDVDPAFQLRSYAWTTKLPLSILTDFEEFAVYDCRMRPVKTDKPAKARVMYLTYDEYAHRWDEIADVFSRDAVLKGSFDKYAETTKRKRGTADVDEAFLQEIESWRKTLARNIALRNPELAQRELNFAVQRIIDRVIFLRICEDRGIEPYEQMRDLAKSDSVYEALVQLFRRADERYNSGLFHFRQEKGRADYPDELTLGLVIDDKLLKQIINSLYYPENPYAFRVLPADILGQVYEQFLGKVIRLTAGHRAKVEDKPEVKKAGGVYYTPTYIVDYIVQQTVGKLVEGKTPGQISELRILDPACGSGSFLLGAYQYLLDYHRDWYENNDPAKYARHRQPAVYQGPGEGWRLTGAEKKRILLNNIYGVDIDRQAVEVTKLSLLLKVLEGETEETLGQQLSLWRERALPDLGSNIKCGNSLIDTGYFENQLLPDESTLQQVNPFDWETAFPKIATAGGFDAVIGNPPYGIPFMPEELSYLLAKFPQADKFPDSYCLFIIRGLQLLREEGLLSLIVPNTFCDLENCDLFRRWILTEYRLSRIWQSGWAFRSAIVDTLVFVISKAQPDSEHTVSIAVKNRSYERFNRQFLANQLHKIDYRNSEDDKRVLQTVLDSENVQPLGTLALVKAGVKMYERGKGQPPQTAATLQNRPFSRIGECPANWRPLFRGKHISRYALKPTEEFVSYGPWLAAPRSPDLFIGPKILMRRTDDRLMACLESDDAICVNSCHVVKTLATSGISNAYVLGIVNSRLLQRIFELQNPQMVGKIYAEIKVVYVERLPIRRIRFDDLKDATRHDKMVALVEHMLELHRNLASATIPADKRLYERQIEATDRQIDQLVYELYELTDEEIEIVEEATR